MAINYNLLLLVKQGNEPAFKQVFELYFKQVYQFAFKYVKNKQDAEDIAQNVFIKLWKTKENVIVEKNFDGFLFTIAYRLVIDYLRSNALRQEGRFNFQAQDGAFVSSLTAEDTLNEHQLSSTYQLALNSLPPKRKEIFILSRHHGLTNKAIAERLNISVKTVENQMTAALASLRMYFNSKEMGLFFLLFTAVEPILSFFSN